MQVMGRAGALRGIDSGRKVRRWCLLTGGLLPIKREFFIDNLLVRIHCIIEMIFGTGLALWGFEFSFTGSLVSTFLIIPLRKPFDAWPMSQPSLVSRDRTIIRSPPNVEKRVALRHTLRNELQVWHGIAEPGPESGPGFFIFEMKVVEKNQVFPCSVAEHHKVPLEG